MKNQAIYVEIMIVFTIMGLGLLCGGITGKVVQVDVPNDVKQICSIDSDCSSPQVCCKFYNQEAGVCDVQDMCQKINELTKDEKIGIEEIKNYNKETPLKNKENTDLEITIGLIFIVVAIMAYIFSKPKTIFPNKNINRRTKKKRSR